MTRQQTIEQKNKQIALKTQGKIAGYYNNIGQGQGAGGQSKISSQLTSASGVKGQKLMQKPIEDLKNIS